MAPPSGLLLDTDVIAELRSPSPHPAVTGFLHRRRHFRIFVSALSLGELHSLGRRNEHFPDLEAWLHEFAERFGPNILSVDADVAVAWAPLADHADVALADSLIAATALHRGLAVVSGNTEPYRRLAVPAINPWTAGEQPAGPPGVVP
ncbi:PIN domain-containing protein [Arthrobacter sp. NPDC092385]|uniref:PIN domain-containing protein n=1 Tax=Arthrobacter sp. NPDC092385 TaxID=3363943 RepID=UPI0037F1802F